MLEADAFTGYPGISIIKIKRLYRMKTSFCTDAFYEENKGKLIYNQQENDPRRKEETHYFKRPSLRSLAFTASPFSGEPPALKVICLSAHIIK